MMNKIFKILIGFSAQTILAGSIMLDGNLDEIEWDSAYEINDYFEISPYTLKPAEVKTITKVFSNEDGIYIGFTNFQENSSMLSNKSLRDEMGVIAEQNGVAIDFDSDGSKAYMFMVTLANIKKDGIRPLGGWPEMDWDGDWEAETRKHNGYWVSEFYIPWNVVLMKKVEGNKRRINLTTFRYLGEKQIWLNDNKTNGYRVNFLSSLRTLDVDNYSKGKTNFFPFISKTYNSVSGFNENKVGAEVFINTGTGKQINLTVNPDFGQAESDEVIVNFSAQETFYSEKRAFFNENQSLFDLSHYDRYRIINTRRIGAKSNYECSSSLNENDCIDSKKNYTDIDYAMRYTQKNDDLDLGIFIAQESDERYTKGRDFYALRTKKKIDTRTIGYFLTHVVDNFSDEKASVNVVDFTNVKSRKVTLYHDIISSKKEDETGFGFRSQFNYKPTDLSSRSGSILYFDDSLMLNDFGYLKRNDWFHLGAGTDISKINFKDDSQIKEFKFGIDLNYDSDTSGNSNPIKIGQKNEFTFLDSSEFQFTWDLKTSGKDTTITRKNIDFPFVKTKGSLSFNLDYESPSYGFWEYDWRIGYENAEKYNSFNSEGYERRFAKIAGSLYPTDNFKLGYSFRVREEDEWLNWLKDNELATYDLTQNIFSINMNWYKGIKHEIRLKSQFVALEALNPRSLIVDNGGYLLSHNADVKAFSEGITSFQIRYKYEIAPLSYIYLVYTKGGNVYDDENNKDTSEIFRDPWDDPDNEIFSIKFRLKY